MMDSSNRQEGEILEEETTIETPLLVGEQQDQNFVERRNNQPIWKLMLSPLIDETGSGWGVVIGLLVLALVGSILGILLPKDESLPSPWYRLLSNIIGYWYFSCWSVSFYPQVFSNFSRKTTSGLSADFCGLNVIGFACYSAYNILFFYNSDIQQMYRERNGGSGNTGVEGNDVAFAVHALILSLITFLQIAFYDGLSSLQPKRIIGLVMIGIFASISIYAALVMILEENEKLSFTNWLDFLYFLSYVKIFISLIKYIPQVILNYNRKSTEGWSIWNILLDFTGGTLSDLQLILNCANLNDWTGLTGNMAKFGLGSVSIVFDIIFMLQHYVLYSNYSETDSSNNSDNNVNICENNNGESEDDA